MGGFNENFLVNLERPVDLPVVQPQQIIDGHAIGIRNDLKVLKYLHRMNDAAVRLRSGQNNLVGRGRRCVVLRVRAENGQFISRLKDVALRQVIPGSDLIAGNLVGDSDRPETLPRFDDMHVIAVRVGLNFFDRDDDLRDAWDGRGTRTRRIRWVGWVAGAPARLTSNRGCLKHVIGHSVAGFCGTCANVAIRRSDRGEHMIRVVPVVKHDVIERDAIAAYGKIFCSDDTAASAVACRLNTAGDITDMP